jgi:hypothetical protein
MTSAMMVGCAVSAGPAPMPFNLEVSVKRSITQMHPRTRLVHTGHVTHTQAPMKLLYEFALARQILLPKQISVEAIRTGLLPKHV